MSLVAIRQELEESRAAATAARVSEEAGRQQLTRMMDEQLAQNQTIEALRRQVETSNNATQDAQALLRMNQEQQQQHLQMPLPTTLPTLTGGIVSKAPFVQPFSTPSTGLRTTELHGAGYYHVGSPADPGYADNMRAMFGRDDVDPPRRDPPTLGSSLQGTSSQSTQKTAWPARPGQGIPAFPGSRIVPTRVIDSRDTAYRRTLHFGTTKVPKLTRATLLISTAPIVNA